MQNHKQNQVYPPTYKPNQTSYQETDVQPLTKNPNPYSPDQPMSNMYQNNSYSNHNHSNNPNLQNGANPYNPSQYTPSQYTPNQYNQNQYNPNQNNMPLNGISMNHKAQAAMFQKVREAPHSAPDDDFQAADFSDKITRLGFIKKTFALVGIQLLITAIFCAIPLLSEEVRVFMITHWYISIICSVISLIILYAAVYTKLGRKVPINYIMLFAFTIFESYVVAFVGARYEPSTVLLAAGLTTVMVVALSIYAACTKTDFTKCGGFLMICLVVLITGGIVAFFFRNKILNLVLSVVGVIIFGIYLIFDIQLLLGNKKNKFSKDDYVLAALMIYIDIIQIFIYLMQIVGAARS